MVKVTFVENDKRITLKIEGHAGQADKGHDIVCSACSILAYTVAQLVRTAKATGDLKAPPVINLENGDALISCEPWEHAYPTILSIYMYAEVGYKLLAHNYPQYVGLTPFGTDTNP
jgi:uncharacterized protein YsxB (DUF464 family)